MIMVALFSKGKHFAKIPLQVGSIGKNLLVESWKIEEVILEQRRLMMGLLCFQMIKGVFGWRAESLHSNITESLRNVLLLLNHKFLRKSVEKS